MGVWWRTSSGDYVAADHVRALTVDIKNAGPDLVTAAVTAETDSGSYELNGDFGTASSSNGPAIEVLKEAARAVAERLCQGFDPSEMA